MAEDPDPPAGHAFAALNGPGVARQRLADPLARRALRVMTMVHELHKAGYQQLRIAFGVSPAGTHYRCHITPADNVSANGWEPIDWSRDVATYSTGQDDRYFEWPDGPGMTARDLAVAFIDRFPGIAQRAQRRDRAYVGWYVEMLGHAERGMFPIRFADWDLEFDPAMDPPPPPRSSLDAPVVATSAPRFIATADLTLNDVPPVDARDDAIEAFCLLHDGYDGGRRDIDACARIAQRLLAEGTYRASADDVRTAMFFLVRRTKWSDEPMSARDRAWLREALEDLRVRLQWRTKDAPAAAPDPVPAVARTASTPSLDPLGPPPALDTFDLSSAQGRFDFLWALWQHHADTGLLLAVEHVWDSLASPKGKRCETMAARLGLHGQGKKALTAVLKRFVHESSWELRGPDVPDRRDFETFEAWNDAALEAFATFESDLADLIERYGAILDGREPGSPTPEPTPGQVVVGPWKTSGRAPSS